MRWPGYSGADPIEGTCTGLRVTWLSLGCCQTRYAKHGWGCHKMVGTTIAVPYGRLRGRPDWLHIRQRVMRAHAHAGTDFVLGPVINSTERTCPQTRTLPLDVRGQQQVQGGEQKKQHALSAVKPNHPCKHGAPPAMRPFGQTHVMNKENLSKMALLWHICRQAAHTQERGCRQRWKGCTGSSSSIASHQLGGMGQLCIPASVLALKLARITPTPSAVCHLPWC